LAAGFSAVAEELAAAEGSRRGASGVLRVTRPGRDPRDAEIDDGIYVEHEGDDVALFVAMAAETVEDATHRVYAFESEHGGIDTSEVTIDAVGVADSANREDITATEFAFEFPESIPAGPTSLVSPTKESRPTS